MHENVLGLAIVFFSLKFKQVPVCLNIWFKVKCHCKCVLLMIKKMKQPTPLTS